MDWLEGLFGTIRSFHRDLHRGLVEQLPGMDGGGSGLFAVSALALALGAVHALTPGHGKSLVFAYFLGQKARLVQGVLMGTKVAATHVLSAVILVVALRFILHGRLSSAAAEIDLLRVVSHAGIVAVGAMLLAVSIRRWSGDLAGHRHLHRPGSILPYLIGIVPCPLTTLILLYAVAHDALAAGLIMAALMAVGMAMTMAVVGLGAIAARSSVAAFFAGRTFALGSATLESLAAVAIIGFGIYLLATGSGRGTPV